MAYWFTRNSSPPIGDPDNSSRVLRLEMALNSKSSSPDKQPNPETNDVDKISNRTLSSTLAPSNWMSWRRANNESAVYTDEHVVKPDDDDDEEGLNNDEIDDHVSRDRKKGSTSSWIFWSNQSESLGSSDTDTNPPKNPTEVKDKEKDKDHTKLPQETHTNRILNTKPIFLGEDDDNDPVDDAVLYKPHDNTKQFNEINTHKNENLRENIIVPDWNRCLPIQNSLISNNSITSAIFGNNSTSNRHNNSSKVDFGNWRQFLNQVSSKLGFSSHTLTSVMNDETNNNKGSDNVSGSTDRVEQEFNLLYEKTYKLFGRSLAILPQHKRACLPTYNKYYTQSDDVYVYDHKTQLEEDEDDPNTISITNDPMGNLLINHKPKSSSSKQLDIINQPSGSLSKIKRILVIGVHGFFPTKMIRPFIGAPKGTSSKFANEAEKAVLRYCVANGLIQKDNTNDISVQKIALEKEGKIFDRVEFFKEILISWQQELNEADFIFIASHSQGCVVSIILLAQLIKLGILKAPLAKRIGILGMAGINNGPFYGVDKSFFMKAYSAIEHDSLMELFELTKFNSQQSLVYKESMQIIINANVKLCFIGSINDQLVPLYSALASHIFHPNIYRACYIDHSSQTPEFIRKLVSLCCQLQNMGYFDNNVLKELSAALAGPLTGGGHSKIYNDGKVYDLGVNFILDTDDIVIPPNPPHRPVSGPVSVSVPVSSTTDNQPVKLPLTNEVYIKEFNISKIGTNPFILPWCLRGLLFNIEKNWPNDRLVTLEPRDEGRRTGYDEINDLYGTFDGWRPESKVLKDLKFRLNGLRASKL